MTDQTTPKDAALARLIWPLRLTRLGMVAERVARAFWPLWSIVFLAVAAFAFGLATALSQPQLWAVMGTVGIAVIWAIVRGLRRFRMPSRGEALDRLDATMPGRPITALLDHPTVGAGDPASQSVWAAHIARMADRASHAQAPPPDLRLSANDPYALRYMAATAIAMALLFGTLGRVADVGQAVVLGPGAASASGPSWEGWVEPPIYTGLPSLYLADITDERFDAPAGSRISLRFYGDPNDITVETDVGDLPPVGENPTLSRNVTLERSGTLSIFGPSGARSWDISMLADAPPAVALEGEVEPGPPGQMQLSFTATDDYGVVSGTATLRLNPDAADRRYGLRIAPEPREALVLSLPMPFRGGREAFTEVMVEDLSEHPFANLPVSLTLTVTDDAGQIGTVSYDVPRLPGRRFFDPLANAVIEMRRDILWNRENAARAADLLRAITYHPEEGLDEGAYLQLRTAIRRLESGIDSISAETRDQVAEILWNVALELEDGDLDDALERLRRAQERLSEAMRQGASDEEIAQLMQELREAMNDYMQQLAENAEPSDGTDEPDQGERMEMSMADLDEMLRRIEELMQEGRMAEAQEMLNALQQMLENMEITQGEGGDGPQTPGQQAMEGLQDTLRDQQDLSDDSFSELQEQFGGQPQGQPQPGQQPGQQGQQPGQQQPGQQGQQPGQQPGQPGQQPGQQQDGQMPGNQQGAGQGGENDGMTLAERQEALRRQLEEQARRLPGTGSEAGDEALRRLDEAGRAMDEAAEALENGDIAGALDLQSEAMEGLREGMSELGRALAQDEGREPGQGQAEGSMAPDRPLQDPLGRQAGNAGSMGSDEDMEAREEMFRRSRELLDELRRRSSEQDRPQIELDYLRRLLDQF
ncbi:Methyl-accepting chemotaxis protein [Roseibacterium elongatum DSM 19469]|uniref:Methyl-accepting chemotaxis protein n=1 Tax=Roseicyclus elongatus DSM 19469 TaxID=1294273 RepID=W8S4V4_9RHOB|nr:Methyl-accepting chemotaxis protein [Roseibacterium elongatum DSM 19469]